MTKQVINHLNWQVNQAPGPREGRGVPRPRPPVGPDQNRPTNLVPIGHQGRIKPSGAHAKICGVPIFRVDVDHGSMYGGTYRASTQ